MNSTLLVNKCNSVLEYFFKFYWKKVRMIQRTGNETQSWPVAWLIMGLTNTVIHLLKRETSDWTYSWLQTTLHSLALKNTGYLCETCSHVIFIPQIQYRKTFFLSAFFTRCSNRRAKLYWNGITKKTKKSDSTFYKSFFLTNKIQFWYN